MTSERDLRVVRRAYAKQITAAARVTNKRIEDAFATVRREDFLGPGPWQILRLPGPYVPTPSADPVYLYTNDLIAIVPERRINNGQPSLHALLMAAAAPIGGEHVVHVGAGTGYYSALLATLVGATGRVTAVEYEHELAARARENLAGYSQVSVIEGDGAVLPFDQADVIYVNAGATRPAESWLDGLKDGGRLILPLTTDQAFGTPPSGATDFHRHGGVFLVTRAGLDFYATLTSPVAIYPAVGARDAESEKALAAAFATGNAHKVTRLYRGGDRPLPGRCWLRTAEWALAYD
jgi:protein-L-isoaspartate(D-aspartate) O-methyltransferase